MGRRGMPNSHPEKALLLAHEGLFCLRVSPSRRTRALAQPSPVAIATVRRLSSAVICQPVPDAGSDMGPIAQESQQQAAQIFDEIAGRYGDELMRLGETLPRSANR